MFEFSVFTAEAVDVRIVNSTVNTKVQREIFVLNLGGGGGVTETLHFLHCPVLKDKPSKLISINCIRKNNEKQT